MVFSLAAPAEATERLLDSALLSLHLGLCPALAQPPSSGGHDESIPLNPTRHPFQACHKYDLLFISPLVGNAEISPGWAEWSRRSACRASPAHMGFTCKDFSSSRVFPVNRVTSLRSHSANIIMIPAARQAEQKQETRLKTVPGFLSSFALKVSHISPQIRRR